MERLNLKTQGLRSSENLVREQYRKLTYRKLLIGFLLLGLLFIISFISVGVGSMKLSIWEIINATLNRSENSVIVWGIRIPRTLGAILAGASLGLGGSVMQNILRNPLASPFTLGVSHGAAFGAAFAIIVLGAGQAHFSGNEAIAILQNYTVVISAFLGALITASFILTLSYLRDITPEAIILSGVALSSLFSSATMFLQYFADDVQVASTLFWTFGDIGKAGWTEDKIMLIAFSLVFVYFLYKRWDLNAMLLGDETAKTLGVNVRFLRLSSMFLSALIVSVCTAFLGIISFIGLIAPHLVRLLIGEDYRFLIPYSAITGALLLSASDLIARTIMSPVILPVSIVTSIVGAPFFLYLLFIRRTR